MKPLAILFALTLTCLSCNSEQDEVETDFFGNKLYDNQSVRENYQKRHAQIHELKRYFNSIVPENKLVQIEFENDDEIYRLDVYDTDPKTGQVILPGFCDWHLKTDADTVKKVTGTMGWNAETFKILKQKLDQAQCISIENGEPCEIGFQRRDMGKYYYLVFDKRLSDSLMKNYTEYCAYKLCNDSTVLMWGKGALGSGCYPGD